MNRFVFLENHSVYSLCEGTIFISDLVSYAKSHGFSYLSLCDTNGFYGIVNFLHAARKAGLKPIIGTRIKNPLFNGILLARNMEGYSEICSLVSDTHLKDPFNIKGELLKGSSENYFIITSDGELLSRRKKGFFAGINVLKKNYIQDYTLAKKMGVEPVLIYPVYFLNKEDHHLHRLLSAISHNKKLSSLLPEEVESEYSFPLEEEEIVSRYSFMEDALKNTVKISEECSFDFTMGNPILPQYEKNSSLMLRNLCYENLKKRYRNVTPDILKRLERELKIIREKGFSDYFLVVHDFVKKTPFTCGRGSAAASIVAYLLYITHVDPIEHKLFFERFLNEVRPDPPDIDVDFPWDFRDEVLDYIYKRYSEDNTAMVSNHITFSTRSCVREVAKVYGVPETEIGRITKNIDYYYNRDTDDVESFSKQKDSSPLMKRIFHDAVKIHSMPRYLSVHCGGVVITPKPVYSYIPVERAPKGVNIIQLEKDQAEDLGFVKIDVLGNRSLSVVRDTLERVEKHYGKKIRYEDLDPLNDKKTIDMLAKGETIGVFYVESPAMRQLQKKTGRGDYEHLVIHSSIIRPAANIYIREYIERLRGKPYQPLLPEMGGILEETYGIMCYQEDITKIALEVADFSLSDASELRKVISRKNKIDRKLELKAQFYENLKRKRINPEIVDQIWNMIESFSGYSFCKPHSASYALLSFKSCYLKACYPAEFMGAVLKNQGGYYLPLAYISEARRMGLKVVTPDINLSLNEYFGREDTLYIGFMQIKNLSSKIVKKLIEEREKNGNYRGLLDFMERTKASINDTALLIRAGCFRNIERYNQPQLLYMAHRYFDGQGGNEENPLYEMAFCKKRITPPPLKDLSYDQRIQNELELFGFIASVHPMEYYRDKIKDPGVILARDLPNFVNKTVKVAGVLITAKTVLTKNDELMEFVSFEDETDIFETVFFPRAFKKHALKLSYKKPYILTGKVDTEFDVISLNVYGIENIL